jgi:hypothetical protein
MLCHLATLLMENRAPAESRSLHLFELSKIKAAENTSPDAELFA